MYVRLAFLLFLNFCRFLRNNSADAEILSALVQLKCLVWRQWKWCLREYVRMWQNRFPSIHPLTSYTRIFCMMSFNGFCCQTCLSDLWNKESRDDLAKDTGACCRVRADFGKFFFHYPKETWLSLCENCVQDKQYVCTSNICSFFSYKRLCVAAKDIDERWNFFSLHTHTHISDVS